jgi:CDP-2,3-bis-(O-geranylgeranyl)-sn-glycerol synthase
LSKTPGIILDMLFFAPAFTANAAPLILKNFFKRRHPVDFGGFFIDGKRIFGDNKSWEGFMSGLLFGALTGLALAPLYSRTYIEFTLVGLIEGLSAMVGDLTNSFLKRRLDLRPGAPLPVLDQTSFIIVTIALVKAFGIDSIVYTDIGVPELMFVVLAALILHPITNFIAYLLKLKEVPY